MPSGAERIRAFVEGKTGNRQLVIAIDGPAGAGKSTVAKAIAQALNYTYIDTGAMYRAVALAALRSGVPLDDEQALTELAQQLHIELQPAPGGNRVLLNGEDVTEALRTPEVGAAASPVAAVPGVRHRLVEQQRAMARRGGVVMDGRDIGTVVFPDADVKLFLTASAEERAKRRWLELQAKGFRQSLEEIRRSLEERDRRDAERAVSPLRKADDAVEIDTTDKSVDEVVRLVLDIVRKEQCTCSTK